VEGYFVVFPLLLTSAAAYVLGRRRGLPSAAVRPALRRVLECVGLTALFLAVNTLVGALLTLLVRLVSGRFLSLYLVTDTVLLFVSIMQAVALRWWWGSRDNG
jgi:hypothetical protein